MKSIQRLEELAIDYERRLIQEKREASERADPKYTYGTVDWIKRSGDEMIGRCRSSLDYDQVNYF